MLSKTKLGFYGVFTRNDDREMILGKFHRHTGAIEWAAHMDMQGFLGMADPADYSIVGHIFTTSRYYIAGQAEIPNHSKKSFLFKQDYDDEFLDGSCLDATAVALTDELYTLYVDLTGSEIAETALATNDVSLVISGTSVNGGEITVFNEEYIDYKDDYQSCIRYFEETTEEEYFEWPVREPQE